jgi:glycosyltransferase involved in cell wall biosynthesis
MIQASPAMSVVVPLYNEEDCVPLLYDKICGTLDTMGESFEVIFVDDGSRDRTVEILRGIQRKDSRVRVVCFRKNYGQTAAMAAGFDHATGDFIISMDGDLQNDPADIPRLLAKMSEGFDVVTGWRKNRQDKFLTRRVPSLVANWIIGRLTGVRIHDNGCSLKAYRAATIKNVSLYGDMHRFIPAMSTLAGARIAEIVVTHHARQLGESKYGLSRVWKVFLDICTVKMITGFASYPLRWFGLLSLPIVSTALALFAVGSVAFFGRSAAAWIVSSTVGFLLLFLGAHLLSLGLIGELMVRTGDYAPWQVMSPAVESFEMQNETNERDS